MNKLFAILLLTYILFCSQLVPAAAPDCDVLVYSATPGGIAAAVASAKAGMKVILVEPTGHAGGMTTSGLTHTDFHTFEALTGSFLDFAERVERYYRDKYGSDSPEVKACWRGTQAEPHVNELVFEQMLADQAIKVQRRTRLVSVKTSPAGSEHRSIDSVGLKVEHGKVVQLGARIYIDASYEGDLLASANVAYRIGREGRDEYGESLAPEQGDGQLQGYNFRLIMTCDPQLRVSVSAPEGYDREEFVGVLPLLKNGQLKGVFGYPADYAYKAQIPSMPRGKFDINDVSRSPIRLSMPGENLEWPEGDESARAAVFARHLRYNVGLLWFLQNDAEVPEQIKSEAREWGWCKDEFTDNEHLPWQLYVREARRMVGAHIYTERDFQPAENDARARFQPESIAQCDYGPNCHGTSHSGPRYGGMHEGQIYKLVAPYQIPYRVLVPRDVNNLLVPVACSMSHVGFCALRYEATWMSLGQAAGIAAGMSVANSHAVQEVDVRELQSRLHAQGAATIHVSDIPRTSPHFAAVQWIGSLGGLHGLEGPPKHPAARGKTIEGQYFEAFVGHAFQPELPIEDAVWNRWVELLPANARSRAKGVSMPGKQLTRGQCLQKLYDFVDELRQAAPAWRKHSR